MKGLTRFYCWLGLVAIVIAVAAKVAGQVAGIALPWGLRPLSFLELATPLLLLAIASSLCCQQK